VVVKEEPDADISKLKHLIIEIIQNKSAAEPEFQKNLTMRKLDKTKPDYDCEKQKDKPELTWIAVTWHQ